ncbi:hypothetical protein BFP71_16695 [Roseivirga misakiensis]|uniref:Uncharacterized protein n=2 Tax=Roseivirga misakiensis TaxID=1563681 RepID=A0A1E5T172_9BACT|nr:hypothetical protein BFP71_16695 [Roseivirga misakiensis]
MSCPSDNSENVPEPDPEPATNQLVWDGTLYDLSTGLYSDFGALNTGYDVQIVLTDATLERIDDGFQADENGIGHLIGFDLSSSDAEELILGEYTISSTPITGQSTFSADWLVDQDGNRLVEDSEDLDVSATSGTITLSGSGTNLNITFDLQFGQKTLKGNFNRAFTYNDQRD